MTKHACAECGAPLDDHILEGLCPRCLMNLALEQGGPGEGDASLLFGVFAMQLGKVTAAEFMETAAAWAAERGQSVPHRLLHNGVITEEDYRLISGLVLNAMEDDGGE